MNVTTYLFFDGRCDEAIRFYQETLGAVQVSRMRFSENPDLQNPANADAGCGPMIPPGGENKVMHAEIRIGGTTVLVSDGMCQGQPKFEGFSLTINAGDEAEARRLFDALAREGQVQMPLTATFFAAAFGMVADRFGVSWMVIVPR